MGRIRESKGKGVLSVGPLSIDPSRGRVTVAGKPVRLSPTEFEVLYFLAEHRGTAINQETLLREVWGESHVGRGNVVDVCIHRLRRRLQVDPSAARLIHTVKGSGYMLTDGKA
jgi:DNA-binding response OmpR family regulator